MDLHVAPLATGVACWTLLAAIGALDPLDRILFVNHLPDWQLTREHERELQTIAAPRRVQDFAAAQSVQAVVAGTMDAAPDAATIRLSGRQSLGGICEGADGFKQSIKAGEVS